MHQMVNPLQLFGHSDHMNLSSDNYLITFLVVSDMADWRKSNEAVKEYKRYNSMQKGEGYTIVFPTSPPHPSPIHRMFIHSYSVITNVIDIHGSQWVGNCLGYI